ncbi:hypothetical protein T05_9092 [Trichinella murrelli]|uniref:Uncharacterized protein n=1 Tax=Trichinella murrelli TaxID=144512 RepID=A0A0V0T699_9BILA|nr:hypothetical protein T05_9092 [Trichinella murrelli]
MYKKLPKYPLLKVHCNEAHRNNYHLGFVQKLHCTVISIRKSNKITHCLLRASSTNEAMLNPLLIPLFCRHADSSMNYSMLLHLKLAS